MTKTKVVILNNNEDIQNIIKNIKGDEINPSLPVTMLGAGLYGCVYAYKEYAIKLFYYNGDQSCDYEVLKELNDSPYFPNVYAYSPNEFMIVSKVEGVLWKDYEEEINHDLMKIALEQATDKGFILNDMSEYNIIINQLGIPIIIDVGDYVDIRNNKQYHSSKVIQNGYINTI